MIPPPALVAVDGLVVEYATDRHTVRPLDGFTMYAGAGSIVALLGPSGSGKTTVLSVLSGMTVPAAGEVHVNNVDVLRLSSVELENYRRNTIGIVFQSFNLIPSLNARENVAAPLLVAGANRSAALKRADAVLHECGLHDRRHHKPMELSGGQQQRVAFARGLVRDPMVLLADEPTANLGPSGVEAIGELLLRLRARGRTIVLSTHDDRLLPMADQVVAVGPDHRIDVRRSHQQASSWHPNLYPQPAPV